VNPKHLKMIEEARNLDRAGQRDQALSAYRRYLDVQPGDAGAWSDCGGLLMVMGQLEEAQRACDRALRIDAANPGALVNLGCVMTHRGRLEEAEGYFRRVLVKGPRRVDARLALAECLIKKNDLDQAKAELGKAIEHDPANPSAHQALGQVFHRLGMWPEYQEEIERFRRIDPSSAYVEYERGYLDLLFGDMAEGWQGYEARLRVPGLVGPARSFTQPRWKGESFVGRTLLLHYEQGFGDTLMFVRYAPQVKALGGRVLLAAQAPLADLVATCRGIDEVIPHGVPLPPFDLHLPLLSLPCVFQTELESIPAEIPYLDVPERVPNRQLIAETLAASQGDIRIGIVTVGNATHKNDLARSIPPASLGPLATLPGVAWHSFQLGDVEAAPLPGITSLAPLLSNFSDTAYALSGMDLIITVDTAVAHLAGALGIPVFILLPFSPDWRWMLGREDSPWYPTMRLYRQPDPGDWATAIGQVVTDLSDG
jgi:Tfp pilus assembly protein PilF